MLALVDQLMDGQKDEGEVVDEQVINRLVT